VRACIRAAVPLGYRPGEIRALIPRDWRLIQLAYSERAQRQGPGGRAPGRAEHDALMARHGAPSGSIKER